MITAKIGKKKLKCKITVKQKVVKKKTVYQSQMVENFEKVTQQERIGEITHLVRDLPVVETNRHIISQKERQ